MKYNKSLIVLLVSLFLVGVIISSTYYSSAKVQYFITEQLKSSQLTETKHIAGRMENHILETKYELIVLSKFPKIEELNISNCRLSTTDETRQNFDEKIDYLLRADKHGDIIECSSLRGSDFLGLNIKNKEYFTAPKETGEPYITGTANQGPGSNVIISVPLFETTSYTPYPNFMGEFRGVLLSMIDLEHLYNLYVHPYIKHDINFFVLLNPDANETLMKSPEIGDYASISQIFSNEEDSGIVVDFSGMGDTIITSSDIMFGDQRLRLIIFTPVKNAYIDFASLQARHILSLLIVIIASIVLLMFFISLYKSKEDVLAKLENANVTLKKFGIRIDVEKDKYSDSDIELEPRNVYLVKEDEENHSHELFISSLNRGFAGLGIVRRNPEELKKKYNLQKTSFIWLTNAKVDGIPAETNVDTLFRLITQYVSESNKSVVLIDRLDYIISENNFGDVIKKLHELSDLAMSHECIIILSVNPELVEPAQLKAIEAESIDIYGRQLKKNVDLNELEMGILKLINEKNISNQLASFKDITSNFNITKPTTRVRIGKLQSLGLLKVEQKGRFKSLKITSSGRKIIG